MIPSDRDTISAIATLDGAIRGLEFRQAEVKSAKLEADDLLRRAISARRTFARTALGEVACQRVCRAAPLHCDGCTDTRYCAVDSAMHNYSSVHFAVQQELDCLWDDMDKARDDATFLLSWLHQLRPTTDGGMAHLVVECALHRWHST